MQNVHNRIKQLALLGILILWGAGRSYSQDPYHINYSNTDGLPSSEIYNCVTDSLGRLWTTTDRGVSIYDGYDFKNYTTEDGLLNNTNFKIFKGKNDKMYFCGSDGLITIHEDGSFEPFHDNELIENLERTFWIDWLVEDTDSSFVFKYYTFTWQEKKIKAFHLTEIFYKYSYKRKTIIPYEPESVFENEHFEIYKIGASYIGRDKITHLLINHVIKKDNSFLLTSGKYLNFCRLLKKNRTSTTKKVNKRIDFSDVSHSEVLKMVSDTRQIDTIFRFSANTEGLYVIEDRIQVLTDKGVYSKDFYAPDQDEYTHLFKTRTTTDIIKDHEHSIWITTTKGLKKIPSLDIIHMKPFDHQNSIKEIEPTSTGILAIADNSSSLVLIKPNGTIVDSIQIPNSAFHIINNFDDDNYIVGNNFITIANEKLSTKRIHFNNRYNEIGSSRRQTLKINNGDIIGGRENLFFYNHIDKYNYTKIPDITTIPLQIIKLHQDFNNDIWIGTFKGLYRITDYNYKYIDKVKLENSKLQPRIQDICDNNKDVVFISTIGKGIYYKLNDNEKYKNLVDPEFDLPDLVNCITLENDSTLWMGSNEGVHKVIFENKDDSLNITNYQNINSLDGLNSNFTFDIEYSNGKIWVSTNNGLNIFDPDQIQNNERSPIIILDSLMVENQKQDISSKLSLNRDQNNLTFHYTGVSFEKEKNANFYKYSLYKEGELPQWTTTNNRNIQFTNLIHGDYIFEVKCRNKNNSWSLNPAKIKFTIEPRLQEKGWFKIICLIGSMFLIYGFNKMRESRLIKKEKQKRLLQEAKFQTKVAELDALRSQMNPHFIYNALNSIQNYIFQDDPERANFFISKFSKLMRASLEMSKLEYISLDEEIKFLKNYIDLEKMRFSNKFDYDIQVSPDFPNNILIPPLLLQPFIENSIKHGFNNLENNGLISIIFNLKPEILEIKIIDNGVGIDQDKKTTHSKDHESLGTSLIKERLEIINNIENTEVADLKIHERSNKSESGVVVTITLPIIKRAQVGS